MNTIVIVRNVFTAVGLALLAAALYLYQDTQNFTQGALTGDGVVTELVRARSSDSNSSTYRPVVEFHTDDGSLVEVTSTMGSNSPSFRVGESVQVYYHADRPHQAKINSFLSLWGLPLIFGGIGGIFFLVGFVMIYMARRRAAEVEYLKRRGSPVQAELQGVERNRSVRVNGRSPYRIYAQWQNPFTSKLHVFKSENIWFDPEQYMKGDQVTVLIDEQNPEKHYMDISFLPDLAN